MSSSERANIYERITADILAAIERGAETWRMPWHHDGSPAARAVNVATGVAYRGLNVLALWAGAEHAGYANGLWGTYRCWAKLGAQVRKGERATLAVFWKRTDGADSDDDEVAARRPRMFARGFSLFNISQVDGYAAPDTPRLPESERIAHAEAFVSALKVPIVVGGDMAYYVPATDTVHLPPFERFKDAVSAVGVSVHEHAHASGAKHRLDRDLTGRFGSFAYAMDEAVALSGHSVPTRQHNRFPYALTCRVHSKAADAPARGWRRTPWRAPGGSKLRRFVQAPGRGLGRVCKWLLWICGEAVSNDHAAGDAFAR